MVTSCTRCGCALVGGRFCLECGAEQPKTGSREADPCVGRLLGDRYEVGELIGVGGMGRIHRGLQRSLDRAVAIKFIHPHLMTSPMAVSRFLMEARAASRLSHPNVVNVFDFGRTDPDEGGELYLVMELLSGSNLAKIMEREAPLALDRIANILRQTLLALSEAHRHGITHRDVKPENIFLERHYGEVDHVKVIDFGIASMGEQHISTSGQILGTPAYMAPEQVLGEPVGPFTDVYAVGVILFELLVGRLPFEGTASSVCVSHTASPRPNPRALASYIDVPEEVARVCMRAMAIKPAHRYPDAESFAEALASASAPRLSAYEIPRNRTSSPPRPPAPQRISVPPHDLSTGSAIADTEPSTPPSPHVEARTLSMRPLSPFVRNELPLRGRDETLAWCRGQLERAGSLNALVLWGAPGVGKTRLLHELALSLDPTGATPYSVLVSPPPLSEIGYSSLRRIIMELSGFSSGERILAHGRSKRGAVAEGLQAVFGAVEPASGADAKNALRGTAQALAWAIHQALERSGGERVLLFIDDADAMDGSSIATLSELLRGEPIPGFLMILTSERCPATSTRFGERVAHRQIEALSRADALLALNLRRAGVELAPGRATIEPLYLEHWSAYQLQAGVPAPTSLRDLLKARVGLLPPAHLRALQSIAVTGGGALGAIASAMTDPDELEAALAPLCDGGFVWIDRNVAALSHAIIGEVVLEKTPRDRLAEVHSRVADALQDTRDLVELRAFHAVRGAVSLDTFLLLEEAAGLRSMRGDVDGAIAVLHDAVQAARAQMSQGEEELAASAYGVFSRKLATALLAAGRLDEASGVLAEVLGTTDPEDVSRALVLEQLAILAQHRGRTDEARRRFTEALSIAERRADYSLVQRFRRPIPPLAAAATDKPLFQSRGSLR
jgi:serine/threonine-protein kinase